MTGHPKAQQRETIIPVISSFPISNYAWAAESKEEAEASCSKRGSTLADMRDQEILEKVFLHCFQCQHNELLNSQCKSHVYWWWQRCQTLPGCKLLDTTEASLWWPDFLVGCKVTFWGGFGFRSAHILHLDCLLRWQVKEIAQAAQRWIWPPIRGQAQPRTAVRSERRWWTARLRPRLGPFVGGARWPEMRWHLEMILLWDLQHTISRRQGNIVFFFWKFNVWE